MPSDPAEELSVLDVCDEVEALRALVAERGLDGSPAELVRTLSDWAIDLSGGAPSGKKTMSFEIGDVLDERLREVAGLQGESPREWLVNVAFKAVREAWAKLHPEEAAAETAKADAFVASLREIKSSS